MAQFSIYFVRLGQTFQLIVIAYRLVSSRQLNTDKPPQPRSVKH